MADLTDRHWSLYIALSLWIFAWILDVIVLVSFFRFPLLRTRPNWYLVCICIAEFFWQISILTNPQSSREACTAFLSLQNFFLSLSFSLSVFLGLDLLRLVWFTTTAKPLENIRQRDWFFYMGLACSILFSTFILLITIFLGNILLVEACGRTACVHADQDSARYLIWLPYSVTNLINIVTAIAILIQIRRVAKRANKVNKLASASWTVVGSLLLILGFVSLPIYLIFWIGSEILPDEITCEIGTVQIVALLLIGILPMITPIAAIRHMQLVSQWMKRPQPRRGSEPNVAFIAPNGGVSTSNTVTTATSTTKESSEPRRPSLPSFTAFESKQDIPSENISDISNVNDNATPEDSKQMEMVERNTQ